MITDPHARYFGIAPSEGTLIPGNDARIGNTRFEDWLRSAEAQAPRRDSHPVTEGSHA